MIIANNCLKKSRPGFSPVLQLADAFNNRPEPFHSNGVTQGEIVAKYQQTEPFKFIVSDVKLESDSRLAYH